LFFFLVVAVALVFFVLPSSISPSASVPTAM
jgi:hypothetical protein